MNYSFSAVTITNIISKGDESLIVSLKDESGKKKSPSLVVLSGGAKLDKENIEMPKEMSGREIITMTTHKEVLYVLSQWTIGSSDSPKLHAYDFIKKKWEMLAEFKCKDFKQLLLSKDKASLTCSEGNIEKAKINTGKITIDIVATPYQSKASIKKIKMQLRGLPYFWKKAVVEENSGAKKNLNQTIKIISGEELYRN